MSMCRVFSCVVGRGCLLWPVHSLGKTLLAFALLHFVFQGQTCLLLQVFLDFLLLHSSPLWWKGSPKGNQPEHLSEGLMLKLRYFCHLMGRADSLEKTLMLGKKRQEEKRTTEDEMVEWHHWLNGHDFEQVLEDSEGQGSLACCSPWGCKESDVTEWLTNNNIRSAWGDCSKRVLYWLPRTKLLVVVKGWRDKGLHAASRN